MGNCFSNKARLGSYSLKTDHRLIVEDLDGNLVFIKTCGDQDLKENYNLNRKTSDLLGKTK